MCHTSLFLLITKLWITWKKNLHPPPVLSYNDCNDMERIVITSIIKTGNSLCVVIPKNILKAMNLQRGDQVAFGIYDENTLAISKLNTSQINLWKKSQ